MDDLWGNAWDDSPKDNVKSKADETPKLEAESRVAVDVDAPVWHATEPEVNWQPEIEQKSSLWVDDQSLWGVGSVAVEEESHSPPYSPLQSPEVEQTPSLPATSPKVVVRTPSPEPDEYPNEYPVEVQTREEDTAEVLAPPFRSVSPTSPIPGSPDGFGSFETGEESIGETSWTSPGAIGVMAEDPGWGSAWNNEQHDEPEPQKDAWAAAQEQQMRRNERVPPALIEAVLDRWKELEKEVWHANSSESSSWQDERIEDMEKTLQLVESFLPPLSLAPPVNFSTTSIQKHVHMALKLTKSYKLAITSPLSHIHPSTGSDAWETHVKTYQEIDPAQLDQWAMDAAKVIESPVDEKPKAFAEKKSSGWGFWNKKQPSISQPRPASASGSKSSPAASARPSVDASASISGMSPTSSQKPSVDLLGSTTPVNLVITSNPILPVIPSQPPLTDLPKSDEFDEPQPQPSAVSRFFSRLSRNKNGESNGKTSGRQTTFLSSSDIDFLSDVPSYNDEDPGEDNLVSLEKMLSSPVGKGSNKPAPLLSPPPKLSAPPRISPILEVTQHERAPSTEKIPTTDDDFLDFLGAPSAPSKTPLRSDSGTFRHTLPSPLTPSDQSSFGVRTPSTSSQAFSSIEPPVSKTRASSHSSSRANATSPRQTSQNDFMDFNFEPTVTLPPMPPSKGASTSRSPGIRNDIEDDFDSFVGSSKADDSFNSFTDESFVGSTNSNEEHIPDRSFDREVSLFLNGGSSSSKTISAPKNQSNNVDDFTDFFGSSSKLTSKTFSLPSPPPPRPPSKPSTLVRQAPAVRPSVARLGATKVSMSSIPTRTSTASPAPLLPPPPGSSIQSRKTNMLDDPIAAFTMDPPLSMDTSRPPSTMPAIPGLNNGIFSTPTPPPVLSGPGKPTSKPMSPPPKSNGAKGLSAQDLSFFEGL